MTLRAKNLLQHTYKQSKQSMICTHNCGIETQNTQLIHRHIFKQLSTSTNRCRIEIHHNKLTHRQALTHLLAPQYILSQQIRIPTNKYNTYRATREVKAYNGPIASLANFQ
jgi:hypothetical protein